MSRITIFQFRLYDIGADGYVKSRRWGTIEAIANVGGDVLKDTATEVDASVIGKEIAGMTERGFDPHRHTGFQRIVTA